MNLKQTLFFILLIVIGNLCQAQTLYFTAKKDYQHCLWEGAVDGPPKEVKSFVENGLLTCTPAFPSVEGTFEIVLDEKAGIITKKLGETSEVYHVQKQEVDDNNKKHFTFHVTNEKGENTLINLDAEDNFITFYYTKDGKWERSYRHKFEINYAKIRKENAKKN